MSAGAARSVKCPMPLKLLTPFAAALLLTVPRRLAPRMRPNRSATRSAFPRPRRTTSTSAPRCRPARPAVELMMAVWTPGSYLVREYARNVEAVTAAGPDGRALARRKSDKNRWRVATGGRAIGHGDATRLRPRDVGAHQLGRGGLRPAERRADVPDARRPAPRPHDVVVDSRRRLEAIAHRHCRRSAAASTATAPPDYDTLVDSPIVVGNPAVSRVRGGRQAPLPRQRGRRRRLGRPARRPGRRDDRPRAPPHLGRAPYDKYVFFNMITEAGGGLEHKNSTVLMTSRWATRTRRAYLDWLELASHEFFHAWNVKRLRPVELGPFDYENEIHTRSLWIAEGLHRLLRRSAAASRRPVDARGVSRVRCPSTIEELQTTPGRLVQSAELASFDAWIKYYRPDENSPNTSISYYTKGAVVAFLLDAKIRKATNGSQSLDDVMRAAYERYSGARGYTPDEFRARGGAGRPASASTGFWDDRRGRGLRSWTTPRRSTRSACASAGASPRRRPGHGSG